MRSDFNTCFSLLPPFVFAPVFSPLASLVKDVLVFLLLLLFVFLFSCVDLKNNFNKNRGILYPFLFSFSICVIYSCTYMLNVLHFYRLMISVCIYW